jgi:hypothetical protein
MTGPGMSSIPADRLETLMAGCAAAISARLALEHYRSHSDAHAWSGRRWQVSGRAGRDVSVALDGGGVLYPPEEARALGWALVASAELAERTPDPHEEDSG